MAQLETLSEFRSTHLTKMLIALAKNIELSGLHALAHSTDFWATFKASKVLNIPFILSCHDEISYVMRGNPLQSLANKWLREAWRQADCRFTISELLGEEYCRRYGTRPYEIVTNGVEDLPKNPRALKEGRLRIYFSGSIHVSYESNFQALVAALSYIAKARPNLDVSLFCRSMPPPFSIPPSVSIKPFDGLSDHQPDLEKIDVMYLPLPFGQRHYNFSRYSLPAKLPTYLASGLPIICHAPDYSGSARLLTEHHAGYVVSTLNPEELGKAFLDVLEDHEPLVGSALILARQQFLLSDLRARFWTSIKKVSHNLESSRRESRTEL